MFRALIYQFSVTALEILLATITRSMARFGLLVIPIQVAMNLLSGSTPPMESMPIWLQDAMQVSPATHFVAFPQAILHRGAGLSVEWPDLVIIALISAAFFGASLARFRKSILASS